MKILYKLEDKMILVKAPLEGSVWPDVIAEFNKDRHPNECWSDQAIMNEAEFICCLTDESNLW